MAKEIVVNGARTIIGMVHCLPLPGTPGYDGNFERVLHQAVQDALTLEEAGADAVIVENMGDVPFTAELNKSQIVALSAISVKVREAISIPMGIDAAFNDCETSLNIARVIGAEFVRIPVFVDTVIFTDGIIYPCARRCAEIRKMLGGDKIKIVADVQVKHSYMLNNAITIEQSAKDAVSNGADAIIVSGTSVGEETPLDLIKRVKKVVKVPVLAGSGVNKDNITVQLEVADGCIIGSGLKKGGIISNPIDLEMTKEVVKANKKAKRSKKSK